MKQNIVLIGMPGSGKTTIGRLLAERLNMEFIDTDNYIEEKYKTKISCIFEKGEDCFRGIESDALKEVCKTPPRVIATGGGVVKRDENMEILGENGVIIFINRDVKNIISDIDIKSRPLLADGIEKIHRLFEERYELYKRYCNYEVINGCGIESVIDDITAILRREGIINETSYN